LSGPSDGRFPFKTLLFWVLGAFTLIAAGLAAGIFLTQRSGSDALALQSRTQQALQAQIRVDLEAQVAEALARAQQVRNELTIEQAARAELEKSLTALQEELGRSKDHLAFYEQLLPPGPQGAIALRAVEFEKQSQALAFRVLLMRSGKPGERFNGRLQFVASGLKDGKEVTAVLEPSQRLDTGTSKNPLNTLGAATQGEDSLKLSFDQFQRSQGVLALPKDFQPTSVVVSILSGEIVLASRKVDL
jgi:low affinity Fe/Cu permease